MAARPWQEIAASGRLRVAVKDNLPPLAWRDSHGTWQGFEIAIATELAERMLGDGATVEFVAVSHQDRLAATIDDRVDLAIAQIGITIDRLRLVSFTEPYYLDGTTVVVPLGSPLTSTLDLTDETLAVLAGSAAIATLNAAAPELALVGVSSYREGLETLQQGQVDGFAADASVMAGWVAEQSDYRLLQPLLSGSGLAIALPKGNQASELRRRTHSIVRELADSGWFETQAEQWGLP
ncbi:transporter substrate-binding domain-containing protein [Synechococcus sp. PCC 7336]|uniref:transporter substrate-binding domain-containing protein n=1 Tax=Synechococcus sp. PCC 7336 TaxID=195250 RepID=UPI00138ABF7E|nr:transporter substrate-binding domain-containing protein [Synechococcus sp. PCC 7336]